MIPQFLTEPARLGEAQRASGSLVRRRWSPWPEPAHSRLSVEDRFCGAPVARITMIW
jgi:hypothetical protein